MWFAMQEGDLDTGAKFIALRRGSFHVYHYSQIAEPVGSTSLLR